MTDQLQMSLLLLGILFLCLYLLLCRGLSSRVREQGRRAAGAVTLLLLMAAVTAGVVLALRFTGCSLTLAVMAAQLLLILASAVYAPFRLYAGWHAIPKVPAILLPLYMLGLVYITLFSRPGGSSGSIFLSCHSLILFVHTGRAEALLDFFLNILLFIPFGFLVPALLPDRRKLLLVFPAAVLCSAAIESLQLIFCLGVADIEDLLANPLGALAGYGLYALSGRRLTRS